MESHHDPRYHAPARLSDLVGEERRRALIARDTARREAYQQTLRSPAKRPLLSRLFGAVLNKEGPA
jgi:hypothetical protein